MNVEGLVNLVCFLVMNLVNVALWSFDPPELIHSIVREEKKLHSSLWLFKIEKMHQEKKKSHFLWLRLSPHRGLFSAALCSLSQCPEKVEFTEFKHLLFKEKCFFFFSPPLRLHISFSGRKGFRAEGGKGQARGLAGAESLQPHPAGAVTHAAAVTGWYRPFSTGRRTGCN